MTVPGNIYHKKNENKSYYFESYLLLLNYLVSLILKKRNNKIDPWFYGSLCLTSWRGAVTSRSHCEVAKQPAGTPESWQIRERLHECFCESDL